MLMRVSCTMLLCLLLVYASAQQFLKKVRSVSAFTAVDDKVFFSAADDINGEELWISDGSPEGTFMLKDINQGYNSSTPSHMTSFKGKLFFTASTPEFGGELWTSDGTAAGTVMITDLATGEGSNPRFFKVFKEHLYFSTNQGGLYKSDGTAAGTVLLEQIDYSGIGLVQAGNNFLYYTAGYPFDIKRTNGTTVTSISLPPAGDDSYFHSLHTAGDILYVVMASSYEQAVRLYTYEENTSSWKLLQTFDSDHHDQKIAYFTTVGNRLFFSLRNDYGTNDQTDQLWVSDGTAEGTIKLKSSRWDKYTGDSEMNNFISYKDMLYFRSGNSESNALWRSDGTPEGTVKVHDVKIMRGSPSSSPSPTNPPAVSNGLLWFCGANGEFGSDPELWYTDGTSMGTRLYADLNPSGSANPYLFKDANGVLYFVVGDSYLGTTIWNTSPAAEINILSYHNSPVPNGNLLYINDALATSCVKVPLTIHNSGYKELALSDITVTGTEFYLKGELPEFLEPNEKITIDVYFKPFSAGKKTGDIIIHSNDEDEPRYQIKLSGELFKWNSQHACKDFDQDMVKSLEAVSTDKKIMLSKTVIEENLPTSTIIGTLSIPGSSGLTTYTLVNGEGDEGNDQFLIEGNQLTANRVFDHSAKNLYTVRIKATTGEVSTEEFFSIAVIDKPTPFLSADCKDVFENLNYGFTGTEFNSVGELFAITNDGRILRSIDEGVNWEFLKSGHWGRLSRIFFKGNTGYITGDYVLLKSDDNGATWFQLYLPFQNLLNGVTAFFLDESKGFVTGGDGYLVYTADGGHSWDIRTTGNYYEAIRDPWFFDENNGLAFAGGTILQKTSDGGRTWEWVNVGTSPQWTSIWFLNNKDGFITSAYNTYRTKDGGKSWTGVPEVAGEGLRRIAFSDEKNGYVYGGSYNSSFLFVTTDGGNAWNLATYYIGYGQTTGLARSKAGKLISVHQNYQGIGRSINFSVDNGTTWEALQELTDEPFYKIDFITEDVGFIVGQTNHFKTIDKGVTWKRFYWNRPIYSTHYFDENNALLSDGYIIYKTTNGGETMDEVLVTNDDPNNYVPAGQLLAVNDDVIFSYSDYALYRSLNGGDDWTMMTNDFAFYAQDMQFISATVGYRMELFGGVRKTVDGGTTWTDIYTWISNGTADPFNSIFFVDSNIGYKAGRKFAKTTDGGVTWTNIFTNFYGDIMALYFTDAQHGYAATRSRNLYETFDGGATWKEIPTGASTQDGLSNIQFKHGNIYLIGSGGYVAQICNPGSTPVQAGYAVGRQIVCAGDMQVYHLSENYSGTYQWNVPGANVNDEGSLAFVQFPHAGEYTFTINNLNQCGVSSQRIQSVMAVELPTPDLAGPDVVESLSTPARYDVSNLDIDFLYQWDVTGAKTFTNENASHSTVTWLASSGDKGVKVFAVDPVSGCSATGRLKVTIDVPLGVEEQGDDVITVYPNPTPAEITIRSRVGEPLLITLYNSMGKEYFSNELSPSAESKLQLQHLPAGLYFLEITNGEGNKITKKIVKE